MFGSIACEERVLVRCFARGGVVENRGVLNAYHRSAPSSYRAIFVFGGGFSGSMSWVESHIALSLGNEQPKSFYDRLVRRQG